MSKINQEEYEVLKGLDDKWKWIARDGECDSLNIFSVNPIKVHSQWDYMDVGYKHAGLTKEENKMFQFIQWEDEEPHNIAELIKEYEQKEFYDYVGWEYYESEETEVKNIEWAKKEIKELMTEESQNYPHDEMVEKEIVLGILNQLEETEVLSQEWIDKRAEYYEYFGYAGVPIDDLKDLLVPKQELPVVPQYVVDWYEEHKDNLEGQLQGIAYNLDKHGTMPVLNKVDDWINKTEKPLQTLASLSFGYEVKEEEQKYHVIDRHKVYLLAKEEELNKVETVAKLVEFYGHEHVELNYQLTEQEIKDYDERYFAFAVKVKELEE